MNEERLREALAELDAGASATGACPEPGVLWDLASGSLAAGRARSIGLHAVGCGACREALRIAREALRIAPAAPRISRGAWRGWAAAAAALMILALAVIFRDSRVESPAPSAYREDPSAAISAETPRAVVESGEPVLLRWTAVGEARYDLTIARETLEVLTVARGLERPEYEVPAGVLATLPEGGALLWQVEAVLPDGRRVRSATFTVRRE